MQNKQNIQTKQRSLRTNEDWIQTVLILISPSFLTSLTIIILRSEIATMEKSVR